VGTSAATAQSCLVSLPHFFLRVFVTALVRLYLLLVSSVNDPSRLRIRHGDLHLPSSFYDYQEEEPTPERQVKQSTSIRLFSGKRLTQGVASSSCDNFRLAVTAVMRVILRRRLGDTRILCALRLSGAL
jgi:hypothetical protein